MNSGNYNIIISVHLIITNQSKCSPNIHKYQTDYIILHYKFISFIELYNYSKTSPITHPKKYKSLTLSL